MLSSEQGKQSPHAVISVLDNHGTPFKLLIFSVHLESHTASSHRDPNKITKTGCLKRGEQLHDIRVIANRMTRELGIKLTIVAGDMIWDDGNERGFGYDKNALMILHGRDEGYFSNNNTDNTDNNSNNNDNNNNNKIDLLHDQHTIWRDAWLEAHKGNRTMTELASEFATYDSAIPMNGGGSGVRKRLDRIIINQRFDGREEPEMGLSIDKCYIPKKSKIPVEGLLMSYWGTLFQHKDVPVHPSDHFAVCAEFTVYGG